MAIRAGKPERTVQPGVKLGSQGNNYAGILSGADLQALLENRVDCISISIYMPMFRGYDVQQNPTRLKNLLRKAEKDLTNRGMRHPEAIQLLGPAEKLLANSAFWRIQSDGLAIFVSPGSFRYYHVPYRFKEMAVVSDRFLIKPLLLMMSGDSGGRFFVLALSQKQIRFLECTRFGTREIDLRDITPRSLDEALQYDDVDRESQYHYHSSPASADETTLSHGEGPAQTTITKENMLRFFQQVDRGINRAVLATSNAPLLLAGVEYAQAIYREANTYKYILDTAITGNPDRVSTDDLHKTAWEVLSPFLNELQVKAIRRYRESGGSGRTVDNIKQVVEAAYTGKVDTLFVALGREQWGVFDASSQQARLHEKAEPCDEDLLDLAAAFTLRNRGTVYVLDMPEGAMAAAILRYALPGTAQVTGAA